MCGDARLRRLRRAAGCRLEWRVTEDEEAVSGEQAGRRELEGRIREEVGWLREATASVQQPPGGEEQPLEALKVSGAGEWGVGVWGCGGVGVWSSG